MKGTVRQTGGGIYRIALEDGRVVEASLRGRLKKEARRGDRVVIGDRVELARPDEETWTIEAVEPREGEIVRGGAGGRRAKVVAANVDRMVIVASTDDPPVPPELLDRLLVIAEANGLDAALVVNKVDLPGGTAVAAELEGIYGPLGYAVIGASAGTGEGMGEVEELLRSGTSALVGPSGVGKSSLLNAIEPELDLRIGDLSRKIRRGRHTTVSARLIPLEGGGLVADTPGFTEVGIWGVEEETVPECFPEIRERRGTCRFPDCRHLQEPQCAVRDAVDAGEIAASRYASYRQLVDEAREAARPR